MENCVLPINKLKFSYVGYEPLTLENVETTHIGDVKMYQSSVLLSDVVVLASYNKQDASVETIYLSDSIRNSASNAAMMLGNLPNIKVDWISEEISVGNDKNVPLLVNNREMGMQYAKSLNPKRIKSIQIQRYPPGQFSDYPILINIELFENYIGYDVAASTVDALSLRNKHSNKESISLDATISSKLWNYYLSLGFDRRDRFESSAFYQLISDSILEESKATDYKNPNVSAHANKYSLSAGFDTKICTKHIISVQTWLDFSDLHGTEEYQMNNSLYMANSDKYKSVNSVTGLYYQGRFSDKLHIYSSAAYNYYYINENREFAYNLDSTLSHIRGRKNYLFINTDGIYQISDKCQFTLGYNYIWRKYNSSETSNAENFISKENRHKLDATFSYSPVNIFNVRIGGSMIHINNYQNKVTQNYTSWLPRFQLYWRPWEFARINMSYLNEILYPNLDQLSTATWYVSKNIIQTGNPNLKSRAMNYLSTKLTIFNCLSLQYDLRFSKNDISDWYEMLSNDLVEKTFINCKYLHQYVGFSFDKSFGHGFGINFVGNYQWYRRWINSKQKRGQTWYGDLTAYWSIANTNLTLMGEYLIRHDIEPLLQGRKYNEEEMLALGCNYNLLKNKLSISGVISVPVGLLDKKVYTKINIPDFNSMSFQDDRVNSFMIQLKIRFNFGNGKSRKSNNGYHTDSEKLDI